MEVMQDPSRIAGGQFVGVHGFAAVGASSCSTGASDSRSLRTLIHHRV